MMKLEIAFKDDFTPIVLECNSWQVSHASRMIEVYDGAQHMGMLLSFDLIRYVRDENIEFITPDEKEKED